MPTMTMTTFTVAPFATVDLDHEQDGDTLSALLDALQAEPRAIAPVVAYNTERKRLDAIFQVEDEAEVGLDRRLAAAGAYEIFDAALARAGVDAYTEGLAIVEGDDPDLLP